MIHLQTSLACQTYTLQMTVVKLRCSKDPHVPYADESLLMQHPRAQVHYVGLAL